jgi:AcrR family transcriptional regulator
MVQLLHAGNNIAKITDIISAAQKRFGTFGFEKTTMQEIAHDIGLSKAAMYYYFPDKESLYKAVVEKETDIFLSSLHEKLKKSNNPAESLNIYAETRLNFLRTLLNLSRMRLEEHKKIHSIIHELLVRFRENEKERIIEILNKGKENGQFIFDDGYAIATLFLDSLRGLSKIYMNNREIIYFKEEDFNELIIQISLFINIFIKGISK